MQGLRAEPSGVSIASVAIGCPAGLMHEPSAGCARSDGRATVGSAG